MPILVCQYKYLIYKSFVFINTRVHLSSLKDNFMSDGKNIISYAKKANYQFQIICSKIGIKHYSLIN